MGISKMDAWLESLVNESAMCLAALSLQDIIPRLVYRYTEFTD